MKKLDNHLLLFDAECPICDAYSSALIKKGLLAKDGRGSYQQELSATACPFVDKQRAVNEIALINFTTGHVSYGAESIIRMYANQHPLLLRALAFKPLMWFLNHLYAFISFNRRVVVPVKRQFNLQPQLNLQYRIAYLLITLLLTSAILTQYATLLEDVLPVGGEFREFFICGGQVIFQALILGLIAPEKLWDYLGNMMTISFGGALLLELMLIAAICLGHHPFIYTCYFLAVAGLMFFEHIRRARLLDLGWRPTISWVLYRLVVLVLIII